MKTNIPELDEFQLVMKAAIFDAFGNPRVDDVLAYLQREAAMLKQPSPSTWWKWQGTWEDEQVGWLKGLVEERLSDDMLRRIAFSWLEGRTQALVLPFLMTVPTENKWGIGKGVRECCLSIDACERRPELLQMLTNQQKRVVRAYVLYCAEFEEVDAIDSWRRFWRYYQP